MFFPVYPEIFLHSLTSNLIIFASFFSMTDTFHCNPTEEKNWFITLLFFGICFAIITITSVFLTFRFKKNNPDFPIKDLISRIILSFSLLLKTILLFLQSFGYKGLDLKGWESFVISFAGYVTNIAYLSIIYQWCDVFLSVVGGLIAKVFKGAKIVIICIMSFSIVQYIITYCLDAQDTRVVFSIIWDFCVTILFIGMLWILNRKLEIKCTCPFTFQPEQIVLSLCSLCSVALVIRIICFVIYASWYMSGKTPESRSECDLKQMINYICKESFGQFLPFLAVIFSDFLSHYDERADYNVVADTEAFQISA